MKIKITEEQKKKLFIPRNLDNRDDEKQKLIDVLKEKIKNSNFGKISKDSIFEWIQENNLDQELKLSYKGPSLGEVVMTSYNKTTGEVTLHFDSKENVGIRFYIKDIQVGYISTNEEEDDDFYPID
jgi:hypothetical protein